MRVRTEEQKAKRKQRDIQRRWVKALESGEYEQGKYHLHLDEGKHGKFCCLGVLCDLAVKAKVIDPPDLEEGLYYYNDNDSNLPAIVQDWAGLSDDGGDFDIKGGFNWLAGMNDEGHTFKQIAKVIKSRPEGLFVN